MFVLEQCYSHNHQWYKLLLPQGVPFLWRLTNQTVSEDLLSAATAQIESGIKISLTTLSSRNFSVCADLKFIFLSCSTSRIYWLNNSQEPYSTWHLSRTQNQGDAFLIWENGWKTITWNVLQPKTVLNISNFALVLRRQSSVLSISFKTCWVFFVLVLLFKKINHASYIFKKFTCYNCPSYDCIGKTTHMINFAFALLDNAGNTNDWHFILINQFLSW